MTTLNKEIAIKVKETIECGLTSGKGTPIPGQMCIEAAVCYAYGLPHSDNPPCVGSAVRSFKIRLNDARWSSNEARSKGMIKIGIAQLNSIEIDQREFSKRITLKGVNSIIAPIAKIYAPDLEQQLAVVSDLGEANILCKKLKNAAASASASASAAASAADAADASAADASAASAAYAAYAAAYAAADAADAERDKILTKAADLCLEVLIEMKSPGCEYLYLLNENQ